MEADYFSLVDRELFFGIFSRLSLRDLCRLKRVDQRTRSLVLSYLEEKKISALLPVAGASLEVEPLQKSLLLYKKILEIKASVYLPESVLLSGADLQGSWELLVEKIREWVFLSFFHRRKEDLEAELWIRESSSLIALPREIALLGRLKMLRVSGNLLRALPPEIGALKNLTHLWLERNNLEALPEEISELKELLLLDLSLNSLEGLPSSFSKLKKLKVLDIRSNRFKSLPEPVYSLKELKSLKLSKGVLFSREKLPAPPSLRITLFF